jgi:KaiC/GvpD/RAD55 family RecA-like ATPase
MDRIEDTSVPRVENDPLALAPRVSTGVPGLDTILFGGLVTGRPYLIVGPAGTGKTTLALQFLCEGVRHGERGLVVTLEEPPNEMRVNHRGLRPTLDEVYVFDAIPDVMRYERVPFKDIATVRESVQFKDLPDGIRRSPELASVEVTFTALEQTLKMEMARRHYSRVVIDSLTALQYFCMKGFDESLAAQMFIRFLSELRVTTLLTVEAPLEDVETPERLLARGEIRLFRWEDEERSVRALGVEKFRGSSHDLRLHPYRLSSKGIEVNLEVTISRDTRHILPGQLEVFAEGPKGGPAPTALAFPEAMGPWTQDLIDLATVGADLGTVREIIHGAASAVREDRTVEGSLLLSKAREEVARMVERFAVQPTVSSGSGPAEQQVAAHRLAARGGLALATGGGSVPLEDPLRPLATPLAERPTAPRPPGPPRVPDSSPPLPSGPGAPSVPGLRSPDLVVPPPALLRPATPMTAPVATQRTPQPGDRPTLPIPLPTRVAPTSVPVPRPDPMPSVPPRTVGLPVSRPAQAPVPTAPSRTLSTLLSDGGSISTAANRKRKRASPAPLLRKKGPAAPRSIPPDGGAAVGSSSPPRSAEPRSSIPSTAVSSNASHGLKLKRRAIPPRRRAPKVKSAAPGTPPPAREPSGSGGRTGENASRDRSKRRYSEDDE